MTVSGFRPVFFSSRSSHSAVTRLPRGRTYGPQRNRKLTRLKTRLSRYFREDRSLRRARLAQRHLLGHVISKRHRRHELGPIGALTAMLSQSKPRRQRRWRHLAGRRVAGGRRDVEGVRGGRQLHWAYLAEHLQRPPALQHGAGGHRAFQWDRWVLHWRVERQRTQRWPEL